MEFINYTLNWTKGEIFEAVIISIFGLIVILAGFLFWKFGETANSKSMLIPLIVTGVFYLATGISMYTSNQKRMVEFEKSYEENHSTFVLQEKQRVEGFQYMYTMSKVLAAVFFLVGILAFWLTKNPYILATGIAVMLFGLSGLVIDYFSQERADTYYSLILQELE